VGLPAPDGRGEDATALEARLFSREYLLERPLLRAITHRDGPAVLLIDEIDRADDGFEAFLLEVLSDFQVTIPELGTIKAEHPPYVLLTSNRTRELGDALRRRCLYLYLDHPTFEREVRIIRARCPDARGTLPEQIARFLQALRARSLVKPPGVAETLDFTRALRLLQQDSLEVEVVSQTLGCLLKDRHDLEAFSPADVAALVASSREARS
jgi:MoxR-like ATPase